MWEPSPLATIQFGLSAFLIILAIFHIVFVWIWSLSEITWKRTDYVWLAFAGLSLLGAIAQDRRLEAQQAIEFSEPAWKQMNSTILDIALSDKRYACETRFTRSEYSPPDFDQIAIRFAKACLWYQKAMWLIGRELKKTEPNLRPELLADDVAIANPVLRQNIKELYRLLAIQGEANNKRSAWKSMTGQNVVDLTIIRLSPLLLAFALALRITKVTAEIQLAKRRRRNSNS